MHLILFSLERNPDPPLLSSGRRFPIAFLASLIPRQMFDVVIQAVVGKRIFARSTVKALRKNVITSKEMYGCWYHDN